MALLTCSHARDLVTRQALGLDALAEHLRAARAHIATCAACRDYLVRFGRAILSGADELTCAEVRACLDASVGIKDEHMMVHDHLARCPACALEADVWESISVLQGMRIALDVSEAEKARWVAVTLRTLPADRPLGGARVALCNEQGQAQEIKTVRSGEAEARFSDIAPGHYIVRVQHSGKTWELPVNL